MSLTIRPIGCQSDFVAEVSGIDLTQKVSEQHIEQILRSIDEFAVLLFRDQAINDAHQLTFTRQLGVLEGADCSVSAIDSGIPMHPFAPYRRNFQY